MLLTSVPREVNLQWAHTYSILVSVVSFIWVWNQWFWMMRMEMLSGQTVRADMKVVSSGFNQLGKHFGQSDFESSIQSSIHTINYSTFHTNFFYPPRAFSPVQSWNKCLDSDSSNWIPFILCWLSLHRKRFNLSGNLV